MLLPHLVVPVPCNPLTLLLVFQIVPHFLTQVFQTIKADEVFPLLEILRNLCLVVRQKKAPAAKYIPDAQRNAALDVRYRKIQIDLRHAEDLRHLTPVVH